MNKAEKESYHGEDQAEGELLVVEGALPFHSAKSTGLRLICALVSARCEASNSMVSAEKSDGCGCSFPY